MSSIDRDKVETLIRELVQELPPALSGFHKELGDHLRAGLEPLLQKAGLVSREEYDIQVALLQRLCRQVEELERRLSETQSRK